MQLPTIPKIGRLSKKHKITAAGAAAATAVVLAVTGLQATAGSSAVAVGDPTGFSVSSGDQVKSLSAESGMASQRAISDQAAAQKKAADQAAAQKKAAADAVTAKKKAAEKATADAAAKKKAATDAAAKKKAADAAAAKKKAASQAASRSATRTTTTTAAATTYANNLDGWIKESLSVMAQHGIPGTYDGIYRNIMRESSGNPQAINLTDSNAAAGIPSKGLLQVIDPTFSAYHVSGTSSNIYDPVANITAACNYAAARYGSIDNVNSAY